MAANCISGYMTTRHVEYLINPQRGRTIIVASDLCAPGYWEDPEYDNHIQYCVERFIAYAETQPAIVLTLQQNPLQYATGNNDAPLHPQLAEWCASNNIDVVRVRDDYGFKPYLPMRHALVFGIHRELCVIAHLYALANLSPMVRPVCLVDCTVPLLPSEANIPLYIARHHPTIDMVHSQNTSFVD